MRCVILLSIVLFLVGLVSSEGAGESLLVGAFNVQIFGKSKIKKDDVIGVLTKVLSRYDLVLVQEIRDSSETSFPELVNQLNSEYDDLYEYEISGRVGRTSSKEQYGFIYRKDKLEVKSMYQVADELDLFEREPFIVRFGRIDNAGLLSEFTFIALHAKPDDAIAEMNNLVEVYDEARRHYGPDAIIAGDLNADCSYVCESCWNEVQLRKDPRFRWIISDDADTSVSRNSCAYDRIILAGEELQKNGYCSNVFRYGEEYKLEEELVADVSDHFPVEFTIN
ncbi:deoxyribonuclease-1-like [Clavelina lepadiformis]|uniref:deoxyribonuclease-1-like n=1 Tax=Clavelina lepadiformis TaxID=159417 RepID=UPI0040419AF5